MSTQRIYSRDPISDIHLYPDLINERISIDIPIPREKLDQMGVAGTTWKTTVNLSAYGGNFTRALNAARRNRDQVATDFWGDEWRGRGGHGVRVPKQNIRQGSGPNVLAPGIRIDRRSIHAFWVEWGPTGRKKRYASFSVRKYSRDEAERMTREARQSGVEKTLLLPIRQVPPLTSSLKRMQGRDPGWIVRWKGQHIAAYHDREYSSGEGLRSWWGIIEAVACLRETELKRCYRTQIGCSGAWLRRTYNALMGLKG